MQFFKRFECLTRFYKSFHLRVVQNAPRMQVTKVITYEWSLHGKCSLDCCPASRSSLQLILTWDLQLEQLLKNWRLTSGDGYSRIPISHKASASVVRDDKMFTEHSIWTKASPKPRITSGVDEEAGRSSRRRTLPPFLETDAIIRYMK